MCTRSGKIYNFWADDIVTIFFKTSMDGFPHRNLNISNKFTLQELGRILRKKTGFPKVYCSTIDGFFNEKNQTKTLFQLGFRKYYENRDPGRDTIRVKFGSW